MKKIFLDFHVLLQHLFGGINNYLKSQTSTRFILCFFFWFQFFNLGIFGLFDLILLLLRFNNFSLVNEFTIDL